MLRRKLRGMFVAKRALRNQFDPRAYPRETYLLCKLEWGNSGRFWIHWVRNDNYSNYHAEEYFLEEIFEPRSFSFCNITLYLSWSPCADCCCVIRDFLERNPNVTIDIRVARIYYPVMEENRRGLRDLHSLQGVTIKVMEIEDYRDCRKTFLQKGVDYHFSPENFQRAIDSNRSMLRNILEGLP